MDYLDIIKQSEMEIEAITRMNILSLEKELISEFLLHQSVFFSELVNRGNRNSSSLVKVYKVDEDTQAMINDFEKDYGCIVYYAIKTLKETGTIYDLFYVQENNEHWENQQEDIYASLPFVATINFSAPEEIKLGPIMIGHTTGGLYRRL